MNILLFILIIAAFIGFNIYARSKAKAHIAQLGEQNPQYVDVRTPADFQQRHHPHSINIPLDQVPQNLDKFEKERPVIVVCRSGSRSGMAKKILENSGFKNVVNGGAWTNL